ncbi:MAG TPA: hypothetical protein VFB21_05150 [Chthonomonadaceae bacterium]|nr:hypothetical protein [Chthonomonadaceae bacterium]
MGTDNDNDLWIMVAAREADFFRALLRLCLPFLKNPTVCTEQERNQLIQEITTALDEDSDDPFSCEDEDVDDAAWFDTDTGET